jgi:hypothetical protein
MSRGSKGCCRTDSSGCSSGCITAWCRAEKKCQRVAQGAVGQTRPEAACKTHPGRCRTDMYRDRTGCCSTDSFMGKLLQVGSRSLSSTFCVRLISVCFGFLFNRNTVKLYSSFDLEGKQPKQTFCSG